MGLDDLNSCFEAMERLLFHFSMIGSNILVVTDFNGKISHFTVKFLI
jgi:hypothetical protein